MGFWQQPERKGLVERRLTTRRALEVPSHCQRGFRNTEQKRRPRQGQAVALLRRGAEFGTEGGHRAKETLGRRVFQRQLNFFNGYLGYKEIEDIFSFLD